MRKGEEQGWYTDPWERHDARWFSQGVATKLVRDGDEESYDEPPDEIPLTVLTQLDDDSHDPDDHVGPERATLRRQMSAAARYGATWGSHSTLRGQPPNSRE